MATRLSPAGRLLLVLASCLFVRTAAATGCPIPLQPTPTSFTVAVHVNGAGPYRFLLDTATSITVITPEVAAQHAIAIGAKTRALTTTGYVDVGRATIDQLRAGDTTAERLEVLVLPIPPFLSHGRVDGILGANFLAGHSYLLDVRRRCLELDVPSEQITGGSVVESEEVAGRIAMKVATSAGELRFTLDSAASFTVLTSTRAAKLVTASTSAELVSLGGRENRLAGTIDKLRIGTVTLRAVPAVIAPRDDTGEDVLLPVTLFSRIYVHANRQTVTLNPQ